MFERSFAICSALCIAVVSSAAAMADEGASSEASTDSKSTWVTSIAPLGSSGQFVAATADGLLLREAKVYSFEASLPTELKPLYSHPAAVWCVDATTDGSMVVSVDYRGNLVVYDVGSGEVTTHEAAFERWCQAMIISPDGKSIIAGNEAGKVMVWDIESSKVAKQMELDGHAVTGLAVAPDGSQVAASDGGGHVHLLQWPSLEQAGKIDVSEETVWCVTYVEDGSHLLVGSSDRHVYKCEAKPDAKAESVAKGTDWITQLAVSPGGQVAAGEVGGKLHFPSTGGTDSMDAASGVWTLCWNGDAQLFAGTRKDGIVMAGRSWKWTEPTPSKPADTEAEAAEEDDSDDDPDEDTADDQDDDSPDDEKSDDEKKE